jgi:hypothetical protein
MSCITANWLDFSFFSRRQARGRVNSIMQQRTPQVHKRQVHDKARPDTDKGEAQV